MCHCGQSSFSSPQIFVQEMNLNFASAIACRHAEEHQKQKKNSSITRRKSRDNWVTSLWIIRRLSLCLRAANPVPMFSGMGLRIPSIKRETSVFHFPVMPSACTRWGTMWRLNTMDCVIDGCGNWTSYFLFLTPSFLVCKMEIVVLTWGILFWGLNERPSSSNCRINTFWVLDVWG